MKITAPYRGRRAVKRLDLTDMKAAFRDSRMWCSVGVVSKPDDGGPHFEITDTDVLVEVVLQPSQVPATCRLSAALWRVPDLGDEVVVIIPEGKIDFMPTISDVLSNGSVPTAQGPAAGRIVITRGEVLVHDGNGGAVSLALKSDVVNVDNKYSAHLHGASGAPTTGPLSAFVPGVPPVATPLGSAVIAGTTVLKAQ